MTDFAPNIRVGMLSVYRFAMTGALSTTLLFVVCWVAGAAGFPGSHRFIALFTLAPVLTLSALCIGAFAAAVFGAIGGAAIALFYNLLGRRNA
jgi:hypothetical protein